MLTQMKFPVSSCSQPDLIAAALHGDLRGSSPHGISLSSWFLSPLIVFFVFLNKCDMQWLGIAHVCNYGNNLIRYDK